MTTDSTMTVGISADASSMIKVMEDLEARSRSFGDALTDALKGAVSDGEGLEGVLVSLASRLSGIALDMGLKPLEDALAGGFSSLTKGAGSLFAFADGGVPGSVTPFASGGVVSSPTYFPMGNDLGLMGEAGNEAIMPLKRGADGKLGVAGGGGGGSTQIVFNVQAQDAQSFRKSEGQMAAMLTRAVGRGRRGV